MEGVYEDAKMATCGRFILQSCEAIEVYSTIRNSQYGDRHILDTFCWSKALSKQNKATYKIQPDRIIMTLAGDRLSDCGFKFLR